jgi:predicted aldo/keto reductase-like oxidoreductase
MHMFGNVDAIKFMYALRMSGELVDGKPGYASQCVNCGACLEKCPQQIQIPQMLAQVAAELEDAAMPERVATARKIFKVRAE